MNLLRAERGTLDSYIPGLDKYLSEIRPRSECRQPKGKYGETRRSPGNGVVNEAL
jgi:hypothetical protein